MAEMERIGCLLENISAILASVGEIDDCRAELSVHTHNIAKDACQIKKHLEATKKLRAENERLQAIVDNVPNAMIGVAHETVATTAELQAENARLQAIVDKLPVTADGVSVVPTMRLFAVMHDGKIDCFAAGRFWKTEQGGWTLYYGNNHLIIDQDCYSTRAAAEAAKERP